MNPFCLLADPAGYTVSDADLLADAELREYWLGLFENHFSDTMSSAATAYGRAGAKRRAAAERQFAEVIAALRAEPESLGGPLGVVELCRLREKALRDHGLDDPFRHIKQRENAAATEMYPRVVARVRELPRERRWEALMRGLLAGNVFDLGSAATMGYAQEEVDFDAALARVRPRPWLVDDFDELASVLPVGGAAPSPWAKAVVFVDNAGVDFILGVMPFVCGLAARGTHVVLAANELPSLNDLTADEAVEIVEGLAEADERLAGYLDAGLFEVVSSGNDIPLIDLGDVSDELNAAAADADLVVLEGMGRSVESNLHTAFAVDSLQVCLLKDESVAARVGGEVFDCVCMYRPVA